MHILYDHQIFSWQKHGGVSRYFSEIISKLSNEPDTKISLSFAKSENLYFNEFNLDRFAPKDLPNLHRNAGNSLISRARNKVKRRFGFTPLDRFQEATIETLKTLSPTILHPTYYSPYFLPYLKNTKLTITIYDLIHEIFPEMFPGDPTSYWRKAILDRVDAVFCISEQTRKDLLKFYDVDPDKIFVTPLASSKLTIVETDKPSFETPPAYLLYVGDRSKYKNFYFFCRAFAKVRKTYPEVKLVTVGGGQFYPHEKEFLTEIGYTDKDHIHRVGVSEKDLYFWYKNALGFVYPSLYEGFGIPILEALQANCPIACSNTGSLPEVSEDTALYFEPKSIESITSTLEKLITKSYSKEAFEASARRVLAKYSWEKTAELTLRGYKTLL